MPSSGLELVTTKSLYVNKTKKLVISEMTQVDRNLSANLCHINNRIWNTIIHIPVICWIMCLIHVLPEPGKLIKPVAGSSFARCKSRFLHLVTLSTFKSLFTTRCLTGELSMLLYASYSSLSKFDHKYIDPIKIIVMVTIRPIFLMLGNIVQCIYEHLD